MYEPTRIYGTETESSNSCQTSTKQKLKSWSKYIDLSYNRQKIITYTEKLYHFKQYWKNVLCFCCPLPGPLKWIKVYMLLKKITYLCLDLNLTCLKWIYQLVPLQNVFFSIFVLGLNWTVLGSRRPPYWKSPKSVNINAKYPKPSVKRLLWLLVCFALVHRKMPFSI